MQANMLVKYIFKASQRNFFIALKQKERNQLDRSMVGKIDSLDIKPSPEQN